MDGLREHSERFCTRWHPVSTKGERLAPFCSRQYGLSDVIAETLMPDGSKQSFARSRYSSCITKMEQNGLLCSRRHEISAEWEHSERFCSRWHKNPVTRERSAPFCSRRYGLSDVIAETLTPDGSKCEDNAPAGGSSLAGASTVFGVAAICLSISTLRKQPARN